jgi:hypothetical protein
MTCQQHTHVYVQHISCKIGEKERHDATKTSDRQNIRV